MLNNSRSEKMISQKIDGTAIALMYEQGLKNDLMTFEENFEVANPSQILPQPTLVDFANPDDPGAMAYLSAKQKKAEELGLLFQTRFLTTDTDFEAAKQLIIEQANSPRVHGIMMQLPLPDHLATYKNELLNLIPSIKDVDGLTEAGREIYKPATIEGVLQMLNAQATALENKTVAIVGAAGEVGSALVSEVIAQSPEELILIDPSLPDTAQVEDLKRADVVFSATGIKALIKADMLKDGVIVYDVGLGDIDESVYEIAAEYTPVKGGVGPNTVIALMRNLVKAYISQIEILTDK